jgi:dTMP kinase
VTGLAVFISIEGLDGSGKTTQIQMVLNYLRKQGVNYIYTREPGGTPLAEKIRQILLDPDNRGMSVISEALLYAAARADHVQHVIRPALDAGKHVICDRYVDSSLVYQGYAGGLPVEYVQQINEMATGNLKPHRTIILDVTATVAQERRKAARALDRMEEKDVWFHEQVREGYLDLVKGEPRRIKVVDASQSVEVVQARLRTLIDEILPRRDPHKG